MGRTINPDDITHGSHRAMEPHRFEQVRYSRFPRDSGTVMVSKALSRLLRHQAENFGIPITKDGWVRLDHVLAWRGLSGRDPKAKPVTIEDIFAAVEDNEKKRFALRLVSDEGGDQDVEKGEEKGKVKAEEVGVQSSELETQPKTTLDEVIGAQTSQADGTSSTDQSGPATPNSIATSSGASGQPPLLQVSYPRREEAHAKVDFESAHVIAYWRDSVVPPPASKFMIRATQGHSIKTIVADTGLLTPISLSEPSTIPSTCVHGTFYGAWLTILNSGGLKRMGRNHVHFAEGPTLAELGYNEGGETADDVVTEPKEVISGMRKDAELLIYVDVRKALEDEKDMEWWRSENGVILTEGAVAQDVDTTTTGQHTPGEVSKETPSSETSTVDQVAEGAANIEVQGDTKRNHKDGRLQGKSKYAQAAAQENKMVSTKYWTVVVDAKGGRGVIWRQGEGIIKQLPERLTSKATPKGRGRGGGRGGSRGRGKQ